MSNRPRTPRYWPRMKVRGARRQQDTAWAEALDEVSRINAGHLARLGISIMEVDSGSE